MTINDLVSSIDEEIVDRMGWGSLRDGSLKKWEDGHACKKPNQRIAIVQESVDKKTRGQM